MEMERRVAVEENHQRSDSTPMSKSSGSVIRIEAITIDLSGAMENHHEARECEHFSIRGYAAEMRKKDMSICLPFPFDGNQNKVAEQTSILPPLHVTKFRWWRCQNCLREIGTTSAVEEIGMVPHLCQSGFISSSTCSHMQCPSDAAMVLSDLQRAPELDNFVVRKTDVNTSIDLNRNEIHLSSCGCDKEKKDEVGHATIIGYENSAGNYANQEFCNPTCSVTKSVPCLIQERHADGPDTLGSKGSGLVEFCGPSCRSHADIKKFMGISSADFCQTGTLTCADGEQRIASMVFDTSKVAGTINEGINVVKGQTAMIHSLDPEERDNLSSDSDEVLAENSHHYQHTDNSSGLIRQKTRKVRLLTELLDSKGNAENDSTRTESAPSSVRPSMSADFDSVSPLLNHMAVQGSLKKRFGGIKGKRKMPHDNDWKPLELICPSKLTKKPKVFKGDAEGGCSPLMPQQEVVPKTNQVKIGDAEKHCAAADGVFPKSTRDVFINNGMEPYFRSSLSPQQAERKSSPCKKKNKQVGAGKACSVPQRNSILGEGSIMRTGLDTIETEPAETVKLQSAHDATARKGLDLSLESYDVVHRNEKSSIAQTGDGSDLLLPQRKSTPREDHRQRKRIMHVGGSSVSQKSAPDLFSRTGLLFDLNEKITAHRTSPLCEMQNLAPRVESRSFSHHQQLDFSGTHNNENTIQVQEQGNDDIPMEIVELMARNQYERCRHEGERNYFFSEQNNGKRDAELMGIPAVHGNGVLKSLQEENRRMRKPVSDMHVVTIGENVGHIKRNPTNCFSEIHRNDFNMEQLDRNSAFAGFSAFSKYQGMQSGGVQISDTGSIRNGNPQNCKWKGDKIANGSRQSEAAEHVRSSLIPNHMPFGLNIPQKNATHSSNFEMHSQFPKTVCEGRMVGDLDLNYMNLNANNLEKQNKNFDSESFRRASAEYPFVCKNRGIDLNAKAPGSVDLHSNDTIPAMQLLSLMDAGMQSSSAFSLDGKPKFFTKHFFPCDHHPKVSLDGTTSKILEKPLLPYDHHLKEFSGRGTGVYNDSSRHPSPAFYGKNHPLNKSCECSPAVPAVGSFASLFQDNGNFKRGTGSTGRVSSKSEERGKALIQHRGRRSQKSVGTSGISRTNRESNPIQDKQKGVSGASDTLVFPLQLHTIEDSRKRIDMEASCMNGTVFPLRSISNRDICSVNRNPADFTIPEAGNEYMISGQDLKLKKKISSKGKSSLINVDGRKRQRATKLTAMKGHSQHRSS